MKIHITLLATLFTICAISYGQETDHSVSNCLSEAGADAKYLKDFRIQLGKAETPGDLRYKAQISLWKNTRYRFTLCNSPASKGQMIFNIKDETNTLVASSVDKETGNLTNNIDYECLRSGVYIISYDFKDGQEGAGVGVVSMIR